MAYYGDFTADTTYYVTTAVSSDSSLTDGIGTIWNTWTNTVTVTSTTDAWATWNYSTDSSKISGENIASGRLYTRQPLQQTHLGISSERLRAERAQREIERIEEIDAEERAELKAQDLLKDLIGEEQLKKYKEHGKLIVKGRKFDYILNKSGEVFKVEKDKIIDLCIHLSYDYKNFLPKTDSVISLLLGFKHQEEEFNRIANHHGEVNYADGYTLREKKDVKQFLNEAKKKYAVA